MLNKALLEELVGGSARLKALRCLFEQPDRLFGTRELASEAGIDPGNASRWLRRWAAVGLVDRHEERGVALFRAAADPALAPLARLLQQSSRLTEALRARVLSLGDKVEAAAIFGSAASSKMTRTSDIDLLLVTTIPQLRAQALFKPAAREIGRPVNVLAYTPRGWRRAITEGDPFVLELLAQPLDVLKGELNAAAAP